MGREIWREWKIRKGDLLCYVLGLLGLFVFGVLITLLAGNNIKEEVRVGPLGSCLGLGGLLMVLFIGFVSDMFLMFECEISMGRTRKAFLFSSMSVYFINTVLLLLELKCLLEAETFLYHIFYIDSEIFYPYSFYLSWPWILVYAVLLTGIVTFSAMVIHKTGGKGIAILVIAVSLIWYGDYKDIDFFMTKQVAALPVWIQTVGLFAIGGILLAISVLGFRKEKVNF